MTTREQLFELLRNLRWLIAISLVISLALFLPDQIRELYRIAAADTGWIAVKGFVAILLISVTTQVIKWKDGDGRLTGQGQDFSRTGHSR